MPPNDPVRHFALGPFGMRIDRAVMCRCVRRVRGYPRHAEGSYLDASSELFICRADKMEFGPVRVVGEPTRELPSLQTDGANIVVWFAPPAGVIDAV